MRKDFIILAIVLFIAGCAKQAEIEQGDKPIVIPDSQVKNPISDDAPEVAQQTDISEAGNTDLLDQSFIDLDQIG